VLLDGDRCAARGIPFPCARQGERKWSCFFSSFLSRKRSCYVLFPPSFSAIDRDPLGRRRSFEAAFGYRSPSPSPVDSQNLYKDSPPFRVTTEQQISPSSRSFVFFFFSEAKKSTLQGLSLFLLFRYGRGADRPFPFSHSRQPLHHLPFSGHR